METKTQSTAPPVTEKAAEKAAETPLPRISGTHQGGVQRSAMDADVAAGTRTADGKIVPPTSRHATDESKIDGEPVQYGTQQATTDPNKAKVAKEQADSDADPASASTQPDAGKQ